MPKGTLEVQLVGAEGIKDPEVFGRSDPYALLSIRGKPAVRSLTAEDHGTRPVWNQHFTFQLDDHDTELYIRILNENTLSTDDDIGGAVIPLIPVFSAGKLPVQAYSVVRPSGRAQGVVKVGLTFGSKDKAGKQGGHSSYPPGPPVPGAAYHGGPYAPPPSAYPPHPAVAAAGAAYHAPPPHQGGSYPAGYPPPPAAYPGAPPGTAAPPYQAAPYPQQPGSYPPPNQAHHAAGAYPAQAGYPPQGYPPQQAPGYHPPQGYPPSQGYPPQPYGAVAPQVHGYSTAGFEHGYAAAGHEKEKHKEGKEGKDKHKDGKEGKDKHKEGKDKDKHKEGKDKHKYEEGHYPSAPGYPHTPYPSAPGYGHAPAPYGYPPAQHGHYTPAGYPVGGEHHGYGEHGKYKEGKEGKDKKKNKDKKKKEGLIDGILSLGLF